MNAALPKILILDFWWEFWRLQHRRTLNSPPPINTTNLRLNVEQFPLREIWKLDLKNLHNKELHYTDRGGRGRNIALLRIKSYPNHGISWPGAISKVWNFSHRSGGSEQGIYATVGSLALGFSTMETGSHNTWLCWLWKPTGNTLWKTIELQRKKNLLLKGLYRDSPIPEINTKTSERKFHSPLIEETHLLSSECIWKKQERIGSTNPRDWDSGDSHYCDLLQLCWHRCEQLPLDSILLAQGVAPLTRAQKVIEYSQDRQPIQGLAPPTIKATKDLWASVARVCGNSVAGRMGPWVVGHVSHSQLVPLISNSHTNKRSSLPSNSWNHCVLPHLEPAPSICTPEWAGRCTGGLDHLWVPEPSNQSHWGLTCLTAKQW